MKKLWIALLILLAISLGYGFFLLVLGAQLSTPEYNWKVGKEGRLENLIRDCREDTTSCAFYLRQLKGHAEKANARQDYLEMCSTARDRILSGTIPLASLPHDLRVRPEEIVFGLLSFDSDDLISEQERHLELERLRGEVLSASKENRTVVLGFYGSFLDNELVNGLISDAEFQFLIGLAKSPLSVSPN